MKNTKASKLQPKRERFAQEYIKDHIGTSAATRAGYSAKSAHAQATRLLKDDNVAARISELEGIVAKAAGVTLERVVKRLCTFAFTDLDDLIDSTDPNNPRMKSPLELSPDDLVKRGAIQEITVNRTGGVKYKMYSAQAALETLKSILTGPGDINLKLSGEVIQKIERVIIDPKRKK